MAKKRMWWIGLLVATALPIACSESNEPVAPSVRASAPRADAVRFPPSPLTTVSLGGTDLNVWPYTGEAFPASPVDPINLVFVGPYSDPRYIRAALLGKGGNRSAIGLPPVLMPGVFDCQWADGIGGGNQTAYIEGSGWMGSAIQLTCGPYNVFRFHLRLFRFGNVTLGGAHFEMNIPGTPNHESLSWMLARNVLAYDLAHVGAAVPVDSVFMGSQTPTYRSVNSQLYPYVASLLTALGAPTANIPNNGYAIVLQLAEPPAAASGSNTVTLPINMSVDIMPKPFCGPGFVKVNGPLQLSQTTTIDAAGDYASSFVATGTVNITPVNPDKTPTGEPSYQAEIREINDNMLTDQVSQISYKKRWQMVPVVPGRGFQMTSLLVGPGNATMYRNDAHCFGG